MLICFFSDFQIILGFESNAVELVGLVQGLKLLIEVYLNVEN